MHSEILIDTATLGSRAVRTILRTAIALRARGHEVGILSTTDSGLRAEQPITRVPNFSSAHIPSADVIVATSWSTVAPALHAKKGSPVHYCLDYEGDRADCFSIHTAAIQSAYRLPVHKVTSNPALTELVRHRFGLNAMEIPGSFDPSEFTPGTAAVARPVRVGVLNSPSSDPKLLRAALDACELAQRAGLDLQVVPYDVPAVETLRSLHVFLGTTTTRRAIDFHAVWEAMACGIPCVLDESAGQANQGADTGALHVPAADPHEIASALVIATSSSVADTLRAGALRQIASLDPASHILGFEATLLGIARQDWRAHHAIPRSDLDEVRRSLAETLVAVADIYTYGGEVEQARSLTQAAQTIQPTVDTARGPRASQ